MKSRKILHSLADLSELLPGSQQHSSPQANHSGSERLSSSQTSDSVSDQPKSIRGTHPGKLPHNGKGKNIRVFLDTKGRKGKTVTVVAGLHHNPETLETIARLLKQHCGAGGTIKEGTIEIQGDNRGRVTEKLRSMNYVVT
jgi:translation initiation factor 1